jgi:uncharacterized protein (TIGR02271 family)
MDSNNPQNEIVIVPGADVVGSGGDKIGTVKEVFPDYITVEKGWFFPSDHYIPASAINDANENTVFLNVTKDEALQKGWENPPATAGTTGTYDTAAAGTGAMATDTGTVYNDTTAGEYATEDRVGAGSGNNKFAPIDNTGDNTTAGDQGAPGSYATEDMTVDRVDTTGAAGTVPVEEAKAPTRNTGATETTGVAGTRGTTGHDRPFDHTAEETAHLDENDTIRVPLAEEELTATKRPVERGQVRVTKDVEERDQTLDVPVTEEHVNVERRVVDRDVAPGETAFQEGQIDVPVRGEEVDVQKRARVGEELEISKEATQRTQQVSDTVRKERAHVENTTDDVVDNVDRVNDDNDESLIDKAKDKVEGTKNRRRH